MKLKVADRVTQLPPYIFSEINIIKAKAIERGIQILSLGIGDPDLPTPGVIVERMTAAIKRPLNHTYSPYEGSEEFRQSAVAWMHHRFGIEISAQNCVALIGSKEGIAHFPMAFLNPGDIGIFPSPGYPVFETSITLAGGRAVPLPLRPEQGFLPSINQVEQLFLTHQPKYLLMNFPSNPTSVVCPRNILEEIVVLCRKYNVILAYDNAYSEIYYDDADRPMSILEISGAMECAIEFHSLSKTFNMTGWRIGFAVGNPDLVAGLLKYKTNIDSGPFLAAQQAGAFALSQAESITTPIRDIYRQRLEVVSGTLVSLGIEFLKPKATFYLWAKVPHGKPSMAFAKELIEQQGLVVTPGIGFGKEGEGFFRMALTSDVQKLNIAMQKLKDFLQANGSAMNVV